ncbi:uncharacterized protein LOC133782965 isoform X2 [Humulus lupulus]|uniref:uncharacterized protein LOC133782965 isoform X2 n=1 Tax=Humulus lupulus TaxID=3486 RepID=UPI002B41282F|nr:uncharacterized protein LOC133782965 isoform X2 [Humulus lupulus]
MEFKFRAVDDRPPPPPPFFNSSAQPYSGQHFSPSTNFTRSTLPNRSYGSPFGDFRHYRGPTRNPVDIRGLNTMLEFGRSRVREEIILSEIARRRELEMEVRRDIMLLERQIGMQRETTSEGLVRWGGTQNGNPRLPMMDSFDERLALSSRSASTAFGALPLAHPLDNIALKLNTSSVDKDKLIVLAKPNPNDFGAKRKATTTPTLDDIEEHPFGLKKKPREEWSCALCHVTATNEKGLNEHLQCKKHKVREAGLLSQQTGKSSINVPSKKKTGNPLKPSIKCTKTCSALEVKAEVEEKPLGVGQNETVKDSKSTLELPIPTLDDNKEHPFGLKKKPKEEWSCALCHVTATSEKGLNEHLHGKKHKVREAGLLSQKIGKSSINVPSQKKTGNPSMKCTETSSALEVKAEVEEKPLGVGQNETAKDSKSTLELPIPEDENGGKLNKTMRTDKKVKRKKSEPKIYKFWCEMCQVGCQSSKVMNDHKRGKKHKNSLNAGPKFGKSSKGNAGSPKSGK